MFVSNYFVLYCLNWSFFPGVFLLHISLKPMLGCEHSIEMQVTCLFTSLKLRFHCRSDCFDAVFWFIIYIYKNIQKKILRVFRCECMYPYPSHVQLLGVILFFCPIDFINRIFINCHPKLHMWGWKVMFPS